MWRNRYLVCFYAERAGLVYVADMPPPDQLSPTTPLSFAVMPTSGDVPPSSYIGFAYTIFGDRAVCYAGGYVRASPLSWAGNMEPTAFASFWQADRQRCFDV